MMQLLSLFAVTTVLEVYECAIRLSLNFVSLALSQTVQQQGGMNGTFAIRVYELQV